MTPTYPPDVLARLQASGASADRLRREGIANAPQCGWCGWLTPEHDPRCLDYPNAA